MLINGASELGLEQEYQKYLKDLVTDATPRYLRMIAVNHLFLTSWMFRTKKRTGEKERERERERERRPRNRK
jgi:curli biogenesis system outer membrane secretion channel CsgG